MQNKAKTVGVVNVLQVGAITKGQQGKELADIRGMYEAGIPAISEDGRSVMNSELYREAMEIAAELDIPVLAHCEDINLVNGGVMNEDAHSKELGLRAIGFCLAAVSDLTLIALGVIAVSMALIYLKLSENAGSGNGGSNTGDPLGDILNDY